MYTELYSNRISSILNTDLMQNLQFELCFVVFYNI